MEFDEDVEFFQNTATDDLNRKLLKLRIIYERCPVPTVILDCKGFALYVNMAAKRLWTKMLADDGIRNACSGSWEDIVTRVWKSGFPENISFTGRLNYRTGTISPFVWEGERLLSLKFMDSLGGCNVDVPKRADVFAKQFRLRFELPMEASIADLCMLKEHVSDDVYDSVKRAYRAICCQSSGIRSLSAICRRSGTFRKRTVNVVKVIEELVKRTGDICEIRDVEKQERAVCVYADEEAVILSIAECIRWLVPYIKRSDPNDKINISVHSSFGKIQIRFSIFYINQCPDFIEGKNSTYYFEGLRDVAGVVSDFNGSIEGDVNINELYIVMTLPIIRDSFYSALADAEDFFACGVVTDAVDSINYAKNFFM